MVRVVLQRVRGASVTVENEVIGRISHGFVLLVGISQTDDEAAVTRVADKVSDLRVFEDSAGKMNLSLQQVEGSALVISQFTLYGDVRRGRRPSFTEAAGPELARRLYTLFAERLRELGHPVECGEFGAHMTVELTNDGPVTILLDSDEI